MVTVLIYVAVLGPWISLACFGVYLLIKLNDSAEASAKDKTSEEV